MPAKAVGDLAGVAFAIVATRRGEHWKLHQEESIALGDAVANVLQHVPIPERELGIATDLFALAITSYVIVVPRLEYDRSRAGGKSAAANAAGAPEHAAAAGNGANAPDGFTVGGTDPDYVDRLANELAGIDLSNPDHVAALNDLAERTRAPIVAEGEAIPGGRIEVHGDEHNRPPAA